MAKKSFYDKRSIFLNYQYVIEIEGIESLGFKEMSELSNETAVKTYEEGGLNGYVHKFPEHTEFSNIELKRGIGIDDTLYDWRQQVIDGEMDQAKRNGTIKFYNFDKEGHEVSKVWAFYNAWPSQLQISASDATGSGEVIIESVSLVVERFERR